MQWENLNDPPMAREKRKTQALQGQSPLGASSITRGRLRIASDEGLLVEGVATVEGLIEVTGVQTVEGEMIVTGVLRGEPFEGSPAQLEWAGPANFTGNVKARIFQVENGDYVALFNENGLRTEGKGVLITPGQPDRAFTYTQRMTHGGYEFTNSLGQSATLNPTGIKISDLPESSSPTSMDLVLVNDDGRFYRGPKYAANTGGGGYEGPGGEGMKAPFSWATVTSEFGPRNIPGTSPFHRGIDFGNYPAVEGAAIAAPASGVVTDTWIHSDAGPYAFEIDHGVYSDGARLTTQYWHCSSRSVATGATVTQGQVIATVGNLGNSYGAHLHWQTGVNGAWVNPRDFVATYANG